MIKLKIIIFFVFILILESCFCQESKLKLEPTQNFPTWLEDINSRTDQTSGITFIGKDNSKAFNFLLCDDVGQVWRLIINDKDNLSLKKVSFSKNVEFFLSSFHKKDFEEIFYDKYDKKVYLSIEGNSKNYLSEVGIYELLFYENNLFSDSIVSIHKINFEPENIFLRYVDNNIGYEGFCADSNYFYLGLEGLNFIPDSLVKLHIANKNKKIIKTFDGLQLNLSSICGLEIISERHIAIIDRNRKLISFVQFDKDLNIVKNEQLNIQTSIPEFPDYDYVSTIESVSYVSELGYIFLIDDPWPKFYVPPPSVLENLSSSTVQKFKDLVPIIHRKKLIK